jgi:hypothetical protein
MFLVDVLFAALIALIVSMIFVIGFGRSGPWASGLVFFLIVFLAAWALGNMATPVGPHILGIYWLPYFAVAVVVALLLAAAMPFRTHGIRKSAVEREPSRPSTFEAVFDGFFWVFMVWILMLIVLGYAVHFSGG